MVAESTFSDITENKYGRMIKRIRKENKMSQKALSAKVGVTTVYLCKIEKGRAYPSLQMLEKISALYGRSLLVTFLD